MAKGTGAKTRPKVDGRVPSATPPKAFEDDKPVFCFRYLLTSYGIKHDSLNQRRKSDLAERLSEISQLTWKDLMRADRHGQGFEMLPVDQLKCGLPTQFEDEKRVMVFRYSERLPMIGIRRGSMYHLLAIEANYNDLYQH